MWPPPRRARAFMCKSFLFLFSKKEGLPFLPLAFFLPQSKNRRMFDFNWSEIALIGVVALVLIGPKDLPIAIRAITNVIKKMRRMAGEFQTHVDDMLRDADMAEVKSSFDEIRSMNLKGTIRRTLDPDGTLNRAFEDPFTERPVKPVMTPKDQTIAAPALPPPPADAPTPDAPSFVPPQVAPAAEESPAVPSFIPPGAAKPHATEL